VRCACFPFGPSADGTAQKEFNFCFFRFEIWAEGLGVNAQNSKLLLENL